MLFRVIEQLAGGVIKVLSGPDAQGSAGHYEVLIWEGEAQSREEALRLAADADKRLDLKWIRIRHELEM